MLGFHKNKEDPMHNRRRFMVISFAYAVLWGIAILYLLATKWIDNAGAGIAFGYIATLSGAGVFGYFKACSKEEDKQNESIT